MSYYNTTNEKQTTLKKAVEQARTQEAKIYAYFKLRAHGSQVSGPMGHRGANMGPTIIQAAFKNYPITSIRRAITDLTAKGLLVKTGKMAQGKYGRRENTWRVL